MAPPTTPNKTDVVPVDDPGTARTKKKFELEAGLYEQQVDVEESEVDQNSQPQEDPTPKALRDVTYGVAAVHIHQVEPRWNAFDKDAEPNRAIDLVHAQNIAASLKKTQSIAEPSKRICITMDKHQIEGSLRETALYELWPHRADYEPIKHQAETQTKLKDQMKKIEDAIKRQVRPINIRLSPSY